MPRLKHLLQPSTLVTIYESLVLPHLYFLILCWDFESEQLVKLQKKRTVRIIHQTKYCVHSEQLLKKSGLLTLKYTFDFQCSEFCCKFKSNFLPDYFTNLLALNNQIHFMIQGEALISKITHRSAHDDVIKWKHFPRYWPFVRGIHRDRWIPHTKAGDAELWCFLWFARE